MVKSKLITLLKTFSKEEMKEFDKFISSPYFSRGRNLKPLCSILRKYYPSFSSPHFTEEKIFRKLYPKKKFDGKRSLHLLNVLVSELMSLAEKFTVYSGFESGKYSYQYNTCLAEEYFDKKLVDPALKTALKNSMIIDSDLKNEKYINKRLEINSFLSEIFILQAKPMEDFKYNSKNILYIYASIFNTFAKFHNKYRVNLLNYNLIYKGDDFVMNFVKTFDPELFNKECDEDDYETKNLILIKYYYLKSFIDGNDNESILNAIDIFIKIFGNLNYSIQFGIFTLLFNRCIGRKSTDSLFIKKGNELIDFVWGKGVMSSNNKSYTSQVAYIAALHFKMFTLDSKGLLKFVSEYSQNISPESRDDIKNYSFACVYFKEKSFGKCLEYFSRNDSLNLTSMKVSKHILKICCLYEMLYSEDVLSEIDSFEHFLRKNKNISEITKTEYFNFINALKKLIKIKQGELKETGMEKKKIIELTQNLLWSYWFKEKLDELNAKA